MWASGCLRTLLNMAPLRQTSPTQRRHAASLRRDGAMNRLSSITTAIAVAIIAAVGALGIYVAKALPGHHAPSNTGATTASVPAGNTAQGAGASSSSNSLNPPSAPPQATSSPPPVTSGST
jgi:hypothetical protein